MRHKAAVWVFEALPHVIGQFPFPIKGIDSIGAQADAVRGAEFGARSPDRVNSRNGYRSRSRDTRTGTIDLQVPKQRSGTYFPEWLLTRRSRSEAPSGAKPVGCSTHVWGARCR